jgi:hypothetical protein
MKWPVFVAAKDEPPAVGAVEPGASTGSNCVTVTRPMILTRGCEVIGIACVVEREICIDDDRTTVARFWSLCLYLLGLRPLSRIEFLRKQLD